MCEYPAAKSLLSPAPPPSRAHGHLMFPSEDADEGAAQFDELSEEQWQLR
jgi:hypothetical protein